MATVAMAIFTIITACSSKEDAFSIDAHLLNMNMSIFNVYSPDGAIEGIDTIKVNGGRFTYERPIRQEGTIVIVFPNFTTIPVFVKPGASIDIEGNAANLKNIKITGTEENESFTEWRLNSNELSPEELRKHAELFINDNPSHPASRWLVRQYFITSQKPDFKKAENLLKKMLASTENNIRVSNMLNSISNINQMKVGDNMPRFTAKDINGKTLTSSELMKGSTVILAWSVFNYESQNMLRQLAYNSRGENSYSGSGVKEEKKIDHIVTFCIEADAKRCREYLQRNNAAELTTICDGMMWESPAIKTLGLNSIPDNIKLVDGKVVARKVDSRELFK